MPKFLTLSGAYGAGKSYTAKILLSAMPNLKLVTSFTTRDQDPRDLPNEYQYLSKESFLALKQYGDFAWTTPPQRKGKDYGTMKVSLDHITNPNTKKIGLMILLPETLPKLLRYVLIPSLICSVYIETPLELIIKRLKKEGCSDDDIAKRLKGIKVTENDMLKTGLRYHKVLNDGNIYDTALEVYKVFKNSE